MFLLGYRFFSEYKIVNIQNMITRMRYHVLNIYYLYTNKSILLVDLTQISTTEKYILNSRSKTITSWWIKSSLTHFTNLLHRVRLEFTKKTVDDSQHIKGFKFKKCLNNVVRQSKDFRRHTLFQLLHLPISGLKWCLQWLQAWNCKNRK